MLNRDLMNHIDVRGAATATMHVINALQELPPHHQVVAVVATFRLLIERFKLDPQDAFTLTDNIMNHAQGRRAEFDAVRAYLENEV
jgi:hypothetical protein